MLAFIRFLFAGLLLVISHAFAATVQDEHGTFTLEKTPQRIVVLELSFADALAAVDVSPIGIADDNDAKRILPEVRAHLKPWQSVGTRAQPSLEAIAALKPDLIIADSSRHAGVYIALQQIAPVLLLKSRNETYAENLQSAAIIGEIVGKKREMQARLEQHKERMAQWASQLPKGTRVAFGTSREQQFNLHTQETWTGSVLASLGLLEGKNATAHAGFQDKLAGAHVLDAEVVVDGNITTSYGLGGAIPFALELVRQLAGQAEADRIRNAIAYRH